MTRGERFLAALEQVIPWQSVLAAIEPPYPKGARGRQPAGVERMLLV